LKAYGDFVNLWCKGHYKPRKISRNKIEMVEAELSFKFPPSYREAMISHGSTDVMISLLDTIVDQNLNLRDVSEIFQPTKIYDTMVGWQDAGMPKHLIPIAKDCAGNLFCFSAQDTPDSSQEIPIHFFDHDFDEVELEADSFEEWVKAYLELASD
jgi:cell wall assembly regulator SMI1